MTLTTNDTEHTPDTADDTNIIITMAAALFVILVAGGFFWLVWQIFCLIMFCYVGE